MTKRRALTTVRMPDGTWVLECIKCERTFSRPSRDRVNRLRDLHARMHGLPLLRPIAPPDLLEEPVKLPSAKDRTKPHGGGYRPSGAAIEKRERRKRVLMAGHAMSLSIAQIAAALDLPEETYSVLRVWQIRNMPEIEFRLTGRRRVVMPEPDQIVRLLAAYHGQPVSSQD